MKTQTLRRWQSRRVWRAVMAVLVVALLSSCTAAQETADDALPIAIQLYTLRDYGTLEEQLALASEVGYPAVELVGTHDRSAEEMSALLGEYGLKAPTAHIGIGTLRDNLDSVIDFAKDVGIETVVMPWLPAEERPEAAEGWRELGQELSGIGARLQEEGLQLAYHNHDFEMREIDGRLALDWLLEAAEPGQLMWQADVAWVTRGGQDPAELLRRYAGRVASIHAKDLAPEGENEDQGGWADVGYGTLDWDGVLAAAAQAGADWYIIEHDQPADHPQTVNRGIETLREKLPRILGGS